MTGATWTDPGVDALFDAAIGSGITSFHVSHEYDGYAFVAAALRRARQRYPERPLQIVAKIGVPHFDATAFNPHRFRTLIEAAADACGGRVDVVQWLVRATPNDDARRIGVLDAAGDVVERTWCAVHASGVAAAIAVFPYSLPFLDRALALPFIDGVVDYLNPWEAHLRAYLERLAAEGRGVIGLRPLGGALRTPQQRAAEAESALRTSLDHRAVACSVIGLSSPAQIAFAVRAAAAA